MISHFLQKDTSLSSTFKKINMPNFKNLEFKNSKTGFPTGVKNLGEGSSEFDEWGVKGVGHGGLGQYEGEHEVGGGRG